MTVVKITDTSFEKDVLQSARPVVVDFWAEWCGPCRQIAPTLEALAAERTDITIGKMNIDENPDCPVHYGVRGIPTLMLFKGGKHIGTKVGVQSKSQLTEWIDTTINSHHSG